MNHATEDGYIALEYHIHKAYRPIRESCMMLHAAGEYIVEQYTDDNGKVHNCNVPWYILDLHDSSELNLKHMCRETIRKHLLDIDPHENLFIRVPKIGLPSSLTKYLLYDVSLEDDPEEEEMSSDDGFY